MAARIAGIVASVAILAGLSGCSQPGGPLALSGDLGTHDPAIVAGDSGHPWFVFSTGDPVVGDGNIQVRTSEDGRSWSFVGTVWKTKPAWLEKAVPGVGNLWAPELYQHDGLWYLYYAASTFGSNRSAIALATNTTLDKHSAHYKWVDRGEVIGSEKSDDFNAIDPAIVEDAAGTPWMAFGSFWSGIRMVKLDWPSGLRADHDVPLRLADRGAPPNAIEGATVVPHAGEYFLIVSRDFCCKGLGSTYNMAVGRSKKATGPYVDRAGVPMLQNGGTSLLKSKGTRIGPGGESYSRGYLAWHYYDANNGGAPTLAIEKLSWDAEGWPVLR
ncbi:arabinan endo-1,5-alpha-L-arabinosidase [Parafrigoribacterium soli]|uniref:arabinan endo-1,5-alpha-L-arabinosidase n=1 Tax=Parafrigoribacterium soli TaxID=3144663 RepID=UPI0032F00306